MRYVVRCPLRIDLAGYWTGLSAGVQEDDAGTLSLAVSPYVNGALYRPERFSPLRSLRGDRRHVRYAADIPDHAGLALSSAQTVAWFALVRSTISNTLDRGAIALHAADCERDLGSLHMRSDAYACSMGGITWWESESQNGALKVEMFDPLLEKLGDRLLLVYLASRLHLTQADFHNTAARLALEVSAGSSNIRGVLATMKSNAAELHKAIAQGDFDALKHAVEVEWSGQQHIYPPAQRALGHDLLALCKTWGALAGKLTGGSGGSFLLVADPGARETIRSNLRRHRWQVLDVRPDSMGVQVGRR